MIDCLCPQADGGEQQLSAINQQLSAINQTLRSLMSTYEKKRWANNYQQFLLMSSITSITSITHLSRHLSLSKRLATNELSALVIDVIEELMKKYSRGALSSRNSLRSC